MRALVLLSLLILACGQPNPTGGTGGGSSGTGGGSNSTGGGNTGGGSTGGGSTGGGTGTGGGSTGGTHPPRSYAKASPSIDGGYIDGLVILEQFPLSSGAYGSSLLAGATHWNSDPNAGIRCTTVQTSACDFDVCEMDIFDGGSALQFRAATTGEVTATAGSLTYTAPADGGSSTFRMGKLLDGGEPVSVASTGGELPAFTSSLTFPAMPKLVSPLPVGDAGIPVDRTYPFNVTWQGSDRDVLVRVYGDHSMIECLVPPGGTQLQVPANLLAQLRPGVGALMVWGFSQRSVVLGEWPVTVEAANTEALSWPLQVQ